MIQTNKLKRKTIEKMQVFYSQKVQTTTNTTTFLMKQSQTSRVLYNSELLSPPMIILLTKQVTCWSRFVGKLFKFSEERFGLEESRVNKLAVIVQGNKQSILWLLRDNLIKCTCIISNWRLCTTVEFITVIWAVVFAVTLQVVVDAQPHATLKLRLWTVWHQSTITVQPSLSKNVIFYNLNHLEHICVIFWQIISWKSQLLNVCIISHITLVLLFCYTTR